MSKKKFRVPYLKENSAVGKLSESFWYTCTDSNSTTKEIISILKKQQYQIDTIVNGLRNILKNNEGYLEKLSKRNIDAIKLLLEKE